MGYTSEFPLLNASGLYVVDTAGNGNCLFNALSDQLYGDQTRHTEIREATICYMRDHGDFYKQFVDVNPGGGVRRNPKRKNAGTFSTAFNAKGPTAEEINRVFESHLAQMARGGTYGDNMEISAFCCAFNVDVKIYQQSFAYMVPVHHGRPATQVAHIAYHTWEHYSSIRNLAGPHKGPPMVKDDRVLEEYKDNVEFAYSKFLGAESQSSCSSRSGSLSVERDADSEEESFSGPKKKQDRRVSRAKRTIIKSENSQSSQYLSLSPKSDPTKHESSSASESGKHGIGIKDGEETEEEDWTSSSPSKDLASAPVSSLGSDCSLPSNSSSGSVPTRLRLFPPKKDDDKSTPEPVLASDLPFRNTFPQTPVDNMQQRTSKPRKRFMSRNERDMLKAAQKAAANERRREAAAQPIPNITKGKENTPAIATHIKVLYI